MIRTLLVDEQKVIREGLKVLLESESNIEVVAAVSNGYAAISKISETNPDLLFISIKLSDTDELDVLPIIRNKYPDLNVIVFTDIVQEQHLLQSLEMGIKGYLLKDSPITEIVEAINDVHRGNTHISHSTFDVVVPKIANNLAQGKVRESLTLSDSNSYRADNYGEVSPRATQELEQEQAANQNEVEQYKQVAKYQGSSYEIGKTYSNSQAKSTSSLLLETKQIDNEEFNRVPLPPTQQTKKNGLNRYFSLISLLSLGLLAVSIGVISVISRRSPQLVVENAFVNGRLVPLASPIRGKLTEVKYAVGEAIATDNVVALVEPLQKDQYTQETSRLKEQIKLKQQQKVVAEQSYNFLQASLRNSTEKDLDITKPQLNKILENLYLNQIRYQEIALKTAKIRQEAAQQNFAELQILRQGNRIPEAQLNLAKNSQDLADLAISEIKTNLENTNQEYKLFQKQLVGSSVEKRNQTSQETLRLQQQSDSQKVTIGLLDSELLDLESKLKSTISLANNSQPIEIKSSVNGSIHNHKYTEGDVVEVQKPIVNIVDCSNLWIEAAVDGNITNKLNTQEPVFVTLIDSKVSLQGKISLIESFSKKKSQNIAELSAINSQIPLNTTQKDYYRIIVDVPDSVEGLSDQKSCGVGQTVRLFFGGRKEIAANWKQTQWLSKFFAYLPAQKH